MFSNRYIRQILVPEFSEQGQKKISQAKVLVVGAGALASPVLMYLSAAGVDNIGVVDADEVDLSNLHRQIIYNEDDIGKPKSVTAVNKLKKINSEINITNHFTRLHKENALEIISLYDLIIDCTDNFASKFLINDACVILKKPCIIGGVIQFAGQISVYNYQGGPTFRCLISKPPDPLEVPSCSEAGIIGMIPGIIGSMYALEAIKIITGIGRTLSGRLINLNGLTMEFSEFIIKLNPDNLNIKELTEYEHSCPDYILKEKEIDKNTFLKMINNKKSPVVLAFADDRKPIKFLNYKWNTMPLYELPNIIPELPRNKNILLICEYGIKSLEALRYLITRKTFNKVYNLKDGVASLRMFSGKGSNINKSTN